jgi:hypothetical protein
MSSCFFLESESFVERRIKKKKERKKVTSFRERRALFVCDLLQVSSAKQKQNSTTESKQKATDENGSRERKACL